MNTLFMGIALVSALLGQDATPLRPPPNIEGPTLKDTLNFIQDKLPGRVNYIVYSPNKVSNTDLPPLKLTLMVSNVFADAGRCSISFNMLFDNRNTNSFDEHDVQIGLKDVREVSTTKLDEVRPNAKADHPEIAITVDPPLFASQTKL